MKPPSVLTPQSSPLSPHSSEQIEQLPEKQSKLRERIDAILGEYAHPRPSRTAAEDKAVWHAHLEEKYGA